MADTDPLASARAWFDKGDSDLRGARLLLAADPPEPDLIAYLSQQAAEKYLKGFLSYQNIDPPRTHNLIVLLDLAVPYDHRLNTLREAARVLRPYAVDAIRLQTVRRMQKRRQRPCGMPGKYAKPYALASLKIATDQQTELLTPDP